MPPMAPKKDDPIEKLSGMIEAILDKREQRAKEASDPQARFDSVMGRLEQFLDGAEKGRKKEPESSETEPKKKGGSFLDVLTGTGD